MYKIMNGKKHIVTQQQTTTTELQAHDLGHGTYRMWLGLTC